MMEDTSLQEEEEEEQEQEQEQEEEILELWQMVNGFDWDGGDEERTLAFETIQRFLEHSNKEYYFMNWKDENGSTMLHWIACKDGLFDLVSLLLEHGADPNVVNLFGDTALMFACQWGCTKIVGLLLDKGADFDITNKMGKTALMDASKYGYTEIVELLLNKGADVFVTTNSGNTALVLASQGGHTKIAELLVDKGADILVKWKKLIQNYGRGEIEKVAIETITQWLEHPKIEGFINWKHDGIGDGKTMLQCAILKKRLDIARLLLEHGVDITIADNRGWTALMYAADQGYTDMVKLMVDNGVDMTNQEENGWTAVMCASLNGHFDVVKLLVDKGADIKIAGDGGWTALMHAADEGHTDIVKLLVDKGADLDVVDNEGQTALIWALKGGHTDIVELLVDKGAALNTVDKHGTTALILALKGGFTDIVKLMVDKGADITIADKDGTTALMYASRGGLMDIVKLLVDKGVDITIADKGGTTALVYASRGGLVDIVKLLVDKGADYSEIILIEWKKLIENYSSGEFENISIETITQWLEHPKKESFINWKDDGIGDGKTLLLCALVQKRFDIAKLLLEHGADVTISDDDRWTALMYASDQGYTDMVKLMADNGSDITNLDEDGWTAVMYASLRGHFDVVKLLVEKGADIAITGDGGWTALMHAADEGHTDIVKLLVDKGADLDVVDNEGQTALIWALKGGHTDIVELLVDKGADLDVKDNEGQTALIFAVFGGHTDTAKLLVDKGADIAIADKDGNTFLMYASGGGFMDIVKLLVDKGADSNIVNKNGETALMKAFQGGYTEIVKLLTERSLSQDIGSLLDAGVTIKRLEELYPKEEVQKVVQARIVEQTEEEANGGPAATATAASTEDGDEENVQVPPTPNASKIERSRSLDIGTLLDAGVTMEKLEEIYSIEEVRKVVQACIVEQGKEEDEIQRRRRGSMARLLFLRSKSTALKEVLRSSAVMDQVLMSLLADPEEKILMCPLMLTPLKDPVVVSSGFVMDRSTALDENGNLRMQLCPFSRNVLSMPVYPCIPIRSKLKAWEAERMNRCIGVAEKMVESKEWDRATKVFDIAETLLQEMGDQTYTNLATKLANLERQIPFIENDVERMVRIHQRLIRAAKGDKGETIRLLREAIKDCCQKLRGLMLSEDVQECTKTRLAFSEEVLSTTALLVNQAELRDEILELYGLDLALAKKVNSTTAIWSSRRRILFLLETQSGDGDDVINANKTRISEFLKKEGLTGNERELNLDSYDSLRYWPQDKLVDTGVGLVRFNNRTNARDGVETINNLSCKADLNPLNGSDHWVEVAFRAIELGYPSYKFVIFSQCGAGTGWEIRVGKLTCSDESNFVEAVWTTTNADRRFSHNEFMNRHVPVDPGQWFHVVLSYNSSTSEVKLYVNGQPESKTVEGTFILDSRFPMIGQNFEWPDRQFKGMVAYASGDTQFPVEYEEADFYVQSLSHLRLQKLRECSEAMVELDLTADSDVEISDSDY